MLKVYWDPYSAPATADGMANFYAANVVTEYLTTNNKDNFKISTSSYLVVSWLRYYAKHTTLGTNNICFITEENEIVTLKANGNFAVIPKGFCDEYFKVFRALYQPVEKEA